MKIMLALPPQFEPSMPNLALPCLTAVLKEAGHTVIQKDVNVESYDMFLSKEELERSYNRYYDRLNSFKLIGYAPKEIEELIRKKDHLIGEVENSKRVFRNPEEFYDYKLYSKSCLVLEESLKLVAASYYRTELTFENFKTDFSSDSTDEVLKAIRDELCNPYIDFYRRNTIPFIEAEKPEMIGISIFSNSQIIPGFTLAYMIKQTLKDVHVVIGGSCFTRMKDSISKNYRLFSLVDSILINEGETSIVKLANCIENGLPLNDVPNLIYKSGSQIVANNIVHLEDLDELPTPCFDGLPLHLYFSPQLVLPVYASRGCYWGRCAFCNFYSNYDRYRIRSAEKVKDDIKKLSEKHGCSVFAFIDDAIPPLYLGDMADMLIAENVGVDWVTHGRFEEEFDAELLQKLARSGCKILAFGLESVCGRLVELMDKGTNSNKTHNILAASSEAGILNHISFFFGFPTETLDEARETMRFVLENIDNIGSAFCGNYLLYKNSLVYGAPEKYKVNYIYKNDKYDLFFIAYKYGVEEGLTQEEAWGIAELFLRVLNEAGVAYIKNCHLYLYSIHYKTNDLSWLTYQGEYNSQDPMPTKKQRALKAIEKIEELLEGQKSIKEILNKYLGVTK